MYTYRYVFYLRKALYATSLNRLQLITTPLIRQQLYLALRLVSIAVLCLFSGENYIVRAVLFSGGVAHESNILPNVA